MDLSIAILRELASQAPSHPFHPVPGLWSGVAQNAFHIDPFFSPGNLFRAFKTTKNWLQNTGIEEIGCPGKARSLLIWNQGRYPLEGFPEVMVSFSAGYRPVIRTSPANQLLFRTIFKEEAMGFSELGKTSPRSEIAGLIGGAFQNEQKESLTKYFGKVWLKPDSTSASQEVLRFEDCEDPEEAAHFMFAFFGKHPLNRHSIVLDSLPDPGAFLATCGEYREMASHFAFSNLIAFQRLTLGIQMVPFHDVGIALLYSSDLPNSYPFPCIRMAGQGECEDQDVAFGRKKLNFENLMEKYFQYQFSHALKFVENL